MPSFFSNLIAATKDWFDRQKAEPATGDLPNGDEAEDDGEVDALAEMGITDSELANYTSAAAALDDVLSADDQITSVSRGRRLLQALTFGRLNRFLPKGEAPAATQSSPNIVAKLFASVARGLGLEGYRPEIKEGRIVGKHSKFYLQLAYLNEFLHPRGADLSAYFREQVDQEGKSTKPGLGSISEGAATAVGAIATAVRRRPEEMKRLAEVAEKLSTVDRAKFVEMAVAYEAQAKARMKQATEDLAAGRISFAGYRRMMVGEIKRNIIAQTILSIGGAGNLTDEILKNMHARLRQDVKGLDDFIEEIKSRGTKSSDLFGAETGTSPDLPDLPQTDALPGQSVEDALTNATMQTLTGSSEFAADGVITTEDMETAGKFSDSGFAGGQENFRSLVAANANEYNLYEVRRLEAGVNNCPFCIDWADKPMPAGALPPIGDPGCYGVKYNKGGCHCTMDVPSPEEVEESGDDS